MFNKDKVHIIKGYFPDTTINLLDKKQQILAMLILHVPSIYKELYKCYAKFLMKNKYE